jgi:hypothetical protein
MLTLNGKPLNKESFEELLILLKEHNKLAQAHVEADDTARMYSRLGDLERAIASEVSYLFGNEE